MISSEEKLRSIKIVGDVRSVAALRSFAVQFDFVAFECDSSAHEVAAVAMRWAAGRIEELEK